MPESVNRLETISVYLMTALRDCVRYSAKLANRAAREVYLRNATRTLQQFDDRILADIGLRRAEIEHAVRNGRMATRRTFPKLRSQQHRVA